MSLYTQIEQINLKMKWGLPLFIYTKKKPKCVLYCHSVLICKFAMFLYTRGLQ